mmetsp:Transcript_7327/g.12302  ORF Transcript_7327/g.12302 Transcript_7327/m.12302 type:complete len:883 (-) Transcript_7327:214-2862(-)|eukprot:CAMPEP_0114434456 /NCGR_PEP_ID=MMETSP0103-20121206/12273_1 /TAXON_ID=37642 ORGANISM="Paraphysomonas imperforata, Strain PA2" /NCGR_SAMPLE_ID=MMETSP0103 /ASSEMBLY_ACC=CAM_ASM_000201 /LENGTH=882 /DNA_ID=CAMNT_0001604349 /DNA_START=74 /DNA_END=2722 /DNA_ORIENTATION=+
MPKASSTRENVKVVCRIRPETKQEVERQGTTCVKHNNTSVEVTLDEGTNSFSFDQIFGPDSQQQQVFDYCAVPLINDVLQGYNATIFAYGQTSSGKTYTMEGTDIRDETYKGIIPRAIQALFAGVSEADENIEFCFKASYVEIYCEKVRDLLDNHRIKTNLAVREDKIKGIYISGVTEEYVTSEDELLNIMAAGAVNRAVAATGMNEGSSRSHSVFSITVSQRDVSRATSKSGKLVLVDLAGSETVRKTQSSGQQLEEAKTINKSLSALGQVINALTDEKATHVPYRDSKLTRILQDSLGGNAKTSLIVACSPSSYNGTETVSTLRFGTRAKSIQNQVIKNETRSVEELEVLLEKAERAIDTQSGHIMALVAQLQGYIDSGEEPSAGGGGGGVDNSALIDKLQGDIEVLQIELDEEREESARKDKENAALTEMLSEKEGFLSEAGQVMQDAQTLYDNAKARVDVLVQEKAKLHGELESLLVERRDDAAKHKYQLEEMQVNAETAHLENQKLRAEIAEMTGDDMRAAPPRDINAREVTNNDSSDVKGGRVSVSPPLPTPPAGKTAQPPGRRGSVEAANTSSRSAANAAKQLKLAARRAEIEESIGSLQELLHVTLDLPSSASDKVMAWAGDFTSSEEDWFHACETKFIGLEQVSQENKKRIKDLETQRSRLEKDLEIRTEKVMQQQLEIEIIRSTPESQDAMQLMSGREQYQMKSLQQRLEQLVAVHRQLLRKFSSLELENGELRKKLVLRDERIKQLEVNAKGLTSNIRQQAERHIAELTDLRESIQEIKVEHTQRQESGGGVSKVVHHQGPKTIRGGIHGESEKSVISPPKSMRGGGGGRHSSGSAGSPTTSSTTSASDKEEDTSSFGKQASGFVSRLFHK